MTRHVEDPRVAALLIAKVTAASEVGIDLSVEPESSLPRPDPATAADVITVMGNLIDNALDATRAHGGRESSVRLTMEPGGGPLVRVADTGPGIAPEDIERVFERGWSTKPMGAAGRGIGLAPVRGRLLPWRGPGDSHPGRPRRRLHRIAGWRWPVGEWMTWVQD
uniref:Uncharacterized protein n=1 Tax=Janibacter limosus TaxID=53458 RepID=A0AC61U178_9MICO|nr:ATP-binding protein [Janibacter limosus]